MTIASGTKLGRYEIRSKIGEGGMGEVYLAQDTKLDRKVALKILPPDVASDQTRMRRFIQEAKAASALNHPNILTIYEIGQTDSTHFIATEYIEGETLRHHLLSALRLNEVLDISVQVAGALAAAHQAGIIHRDIKPENIMLRPDGIVKVLDYGLAKLSEKTDPGTVDAEAATKALVQTEPGAVLGTAAYMSPEQARGLVADARTDIFSLGVVIYEMVAGRAPFGGATRSDLIVALLERDPPPLARFTPEAPAELERIVMKTLAKDRDERYQTAKDLLIDLKRLTQKLVVDAALERNTPSEEFGVPPSGGRLSRAQGWPSKGGTQNGAAAQTAFEDSGTTSSAAYIVSGIRQHKLAVIIAGVALVMGAIALSYFLHARNSEVAIESIAVLPFVNQNNDPNVEYLSDGLTESIINSLTQLPHLKVIPRSSAFRYKGKETDPLKAGNELGVRAVLTGRLQQRGDDLLVSAELVDVRDNKQLWGEHYQRKISDLLAVQNEIAKAISANLRPTLSGVNEGKLKNHYTNNPEAYQLYLKGRYFWLRFTPEDHKKAAEYFNQAIAIDPTFALAYAGLGDTYAASATNGWISPREGYPKGKVAVKRALEIDDSLGEAHTTAGALAMFYDLDWATAEREYQRAIELNPNYEITYELYSYLLSAMGRLNEGIAMAQRGLHVDPLSIPLSNDVGGAYYLARRFDQAVKQYQESIKLDPTDSGEHWNLGEVYELKGMHEEAIKELQKAIGIAGRTSGLLALLGHAYATSGKQGEAKKILSELTEMSTHMYVSPYDLAILYVGLGDNDRALEQLNKASDDRAGWIIYLKVEPVFDPLRADPRFAEIVSRMKFPP